MLAEILTYDERQQMLFEFGFGEDGGGEDDGGADVVTGDTIVADKEWQQMLSGFGIEEDGEEDGGAGVVTGDDVVADMERRPPGGFPLGLVVGTGDVCPPAHVSEVTPPVVVATARAHAGSCRPPRPEGSGMRPLPRADLGLLGPRLAGLIIGDSFVRRAAFRPQVGDWEIATWVPSSSVGKTWRGCLDSGALMRVAGAWAGETRRRGREPAAVAIWLGGNDVYPLRALPGPLSGALWAAVRDAVATIGEEVAPVTMIGPTPRPSRDAPRLRHAVEGGAVAEAKWESTAAFQYLDRPVHRWLGGEDRLRVRHLSVGKWVLERRRESRKVSAYMLSRAALANFDDDGVHLSPAGYEKLAGRTGWLNWLQPSR